MALEQTHWGWSDALIASVGGYLNLGKDPNTENENQPKRKNREGGQRKKGGYRKKDGKVLR